MIYLRSSIFFLGMVLATLVFTPLALILIPFPYRIRYAVVSQWSKVVLWWLALTCNLRYEVQGMENVPANTPLIILSKHQSAWETLAFQQIFKVPQLWVLKRELLWIPFFGWALATLEPIAIDRKQIRQALLAVVEQGKQRLSTGKTVVIFPEGTRVAPEERGRYNLGGALLAEKTGFPVIPVAHNAGYFWGKSGFLKKAGVIQVRVGQVIDPKNKSAKEINQLAETWIESTMPSLYLTEKSA